MYIMTRLFVAQVSHCADEQFRVLSATNSVGEGGSFFTIHVSVADDYEACTHTYIVNILRIYLLMGPDIDSRYTNITRGALRT